MTKIVLTSSAPAFKPRSKRQQKRWDAAMKMPCPLCGVGPGEECFNVAPSHRIAKVRHATKNPHPQRI